MATRTLPTQSPQPERRVRLSRWRVNVLLLVAALIIGRMVLHLGYLQTGMAKVDGKPLAEAARDEIDATVTLQPSRGTIRDSKGNVLALDVDRESLYAIPPWFNQTGIAKLSLALATLTGEKATDIQASLLDTDRAWVPIKRWLEPEASQQISALIEQDESNFCIKAGCLQLRYESRRIYPQDSYAAQVVGAVNLEGVGISGVEGYYDSQLKGITGTVTAEWDPTGNPIWLNPPETRPARDGVDLELTLDPLIQHVIEDELKKSVEAHDADGGSIIVMETSTGAIRGMASYPTYDPNRYYDYAEEIYNLNPAIGRLYEPGSTFKIATVSIGLQTKSFTPETTVVDTGVIDRYGYALSNWDGGANGPLTPAQVLYYSSNVGALQLNELTGPEKFYQMVAALGYGQPTGIDLAGESPGIVPDYTSPTFSPLQLDTNAYGQGISVTPLQQVRMVATIGNDGHMMQPYIVQKQCRGDECEETKPNEIGQPISADVARSVRSMLINSANHYAPVVWGPITGDYGDTWLVPGYKVAAKTGTSSVPDGEGGYTDWTIGSVAGLVPAEQPKYAVLVKIDHPKDDIWGVSTAIPVYQAVAEQLLRYSRLAPNPELVDPGQTIGVARKPDE